MKGLILPQFKKLFGFASFP